jgi:serine/threonine protein kinase
VEGWLEERARNWTDRSLGEAIEELRSMPECPWRLVAAAHAVKLELKRQRQLGRQVPLEQYLAAYPELGGRSGVAADLIWAEMKAKTKAGIAVDLEDYAQAYPNQAAELRSLAAGSTTAAAGSTRKMRGQTPSTSLPVVGPPATPTPAPETAAPRTAKTSPRPSAGRAPASQPAGPQAVLPEQFGRYRIEKQLGQGGMGSVYKAYDTELHRHVALKVPQFGPDEGAEVLERFKQEARAAATLRHTNLCQVYDVGAIDGTNFLTMEFIEGQSLEGYVDRQKEVSPRFIALIMAKLARALKTAHAKNVIHRDLKPSNIMLRDADGTLEPVIVDFGLARRIDPGTARLTQSGLVIGTWQYMTPEQLCGEPDALGPSCDIYALGVIMYELLTSRLPYDAPGQVVRGKAAAPSSFRADLDSRLEAICLNAMAPSRDARYASMGDLATALTDYLRGSTDKSPEIHAAIAPSGPRPQEPATYALDASSASPAPIAPSGPRRQEPAPAAPPTQDAPQRSASRKIVARESVRESSRGDSFLSPSSARKIVGWASVAVVAVVFVVGARGLRSRIARGPGKGRPAKNNPSVSTKTPGPATPPAVATAETTPPATTTTETTPAATTPTEINPERFFDDVRRAIRDRNLAAAKSLLSRYLAAPALPKQTEARALLEDLDRALSLVEGRLRADALGDAELMTYLDQGVKNLVDGIQDQELKSACSAMLMDAFRGERDRRLVLGAPAAVLGDERSRKAQARLLKAGEADLDSLPPEVRARMPSGGLVPPPGARESPPFRNSVASSRPPDATSKAAPASVIEPGFSPVYNGRDLEGWGATYWRNAAKGGARYFSCAPLDVVRRVNDLLVSNDVIGTLETNNFYQFSSLKFSYMIEPFFRRQQPKARTPRTAHAIAELVLDEPMTLENKLQCRVIMTSLAAADAGQVMTRPNRDGGGGGTGTYATPMRAARPPGEWNEMEIKCSDTSVLILLNGVDVNRLEVPRRFSAKILFSFGGIKLQLYNIRLASHSEPAAAPRR